MELLVDKWKLPKDRLYATYFGGYKDLPPDDEAKEIWLSVGQVLMVVLSTLECIVDYGKDTQPKIHQLACYFIL